MTGELKPLGQPLAMAIWNVAKQRGMSDDSAISLVREIEAEAARLPRPALASTPTPQAESVSSRQAREVMSPRSGSVTGQASGVAYNATPQAPVATDGDRLRREWAKSGLNWSDFIAGRQAAPVATAEALHPGAQVIYTYEGPAGDLSVAATLVGNVEGWPELRFSDESTAIVRPSRVRAALKGSAVSGQGGGR